MPCHIPTTSISTRRRHPSLSNIPPTFRATPSSIAACLDLSNASERATQELVRRLSSGRWPQWRLLGMRREGQALYAAVEWLRCFDLRPFSVVQVSLDALALRWTDFASAQVARSALNHVGAPQAR
jgi:hypothetical protein